MRRALLLVLALLPIAAQAAGFSVAPMRGELGAKVKSASFTVANSNATALSFRVVVRKWTQDAQGNDVYVDSGDLVAYPMQFEVPANGKRIVRVGFEGAAPAKESAYRVYIEELPPAAAPSAGRVGAIAVVGRFGIPVFVKPEGARPQLAIEHVSAQRGAYTVKVSNAGTSRAKLSGITAGSGADAEFGNPYLLPGTTREITGPIGTPCKAGSKVRIVATAEGSQAEKELVLPPDACGA